MGFTGGAAANRAKRRDTAEDSATSQGHRARERGILAQAGCRMPPERRHASLAWVRCAQVNSDTVAAPRPKKIHVEDRAFGMAMRVTDASL